MPTAKSKSSNTDPHKCCRCGKNKRTNGRRCRKCQNIVNVAQAAKRKQRQAAGLCQCGRRRPNPGNKQCNLCTQEQSRSYNVTVRRYLSQGLCYCGNQPVTGGRTCQACRDDDKRRREAERRAVFEYYGLACKCCGEDTYEFLEIDHVDGDGHGNTHRREIGWATLYRWLIAKNFPDGFQTLCCNCNRAKFRYGQCPHQREKATILKISGSG